jgi:hypothetical protein
VPFRTGSPHLRRLRIPRSGVGPDRSQRVPVVIDPHTRAGDAFRENTHRQDLDRQWVLDGLPRLGPHPSRWDPADLRLETEKKKRTPKNNRLLREKRTSTLTSW